MALDRTADDARPWIEAAGATHCALVDSEHRVADLYRIINVPTTIWVDEQDRIVRPPSIAPGDDKFIEFVGFSAEPHHDALRAWVRDGTLPFADDADVRAHQVLPTAEEQLARAEFTLAWYLHRTGRRDAAERHFVRAGELAPHDFTIRRGSLPIRGIDPMGPAFADMYSGWTQAGHPYYVAHLGRTQR